MSETAEVLVIAELARDLLPAEGVCLHLTRLGYLATLVIPSHLSSAIPPSFSSNPLVAVAQIAGSSGPPKPFYEPFNYTFRRDLAAYVEKRRRAGGVELSRELYAVVGLDADWTEEVFGKFDVTVEPLSTEHHAEIIRAGLWKAQASDDRPGECRLLAGLPEELAFGSSDLKIEFFEPPQFGLPGPGPRLGGGGGGPPKLGYRPPWLLGGGGGGPPKLGDLPRWLSGDGGGGPPKLGYRPPWPPEVEGSIGLMFNESADREQPFLNYMRYQRKMPVSGIGPLLPEQYWKPFGSVFDSSEIWQDRRKSNFTEDEVIQWLDSKPRRSVLYVAFGSEVGPDEEDLARLAAALEKSNQAFICVVGSKSGGDFADGMEGRVGDRGLIIRGWAPHLLILSHPSTGGFLSHRGWNSMVEVVGQAVPLQAWPSRGDQHHNAKLVVSHRHQKMGKFFGWKSIAETSTHRSPFGTWPFPGKRYYNTDSPGDHLKVGNAASNDMPKNVMDDESKGISETVASEAFASFQFDLKFKCRIGRLQIGASISRLARSMR